MPGKAVDFKEQVLETGMNGTFLMQWFARSFLEVRPANGDMGRLNRGFLVFYGEGDKQNVE